MPDAFPPYDHDPITTASDDVVTQLGDYGDILEDGHRQGLFGVTPKTETTRPLDDARRRTVAMQLWLLGYLAAKPEKQPGGAVAPETLGAALRQFRTEAGISVPEPSRPDAIDDDTWYALNQLVTFEGMEGTDLTEERIRTRWMQDGTPRPALRRAVHLRLFVLGLRDERPGSEPPPATGDALEPFLWVNLLFDLAGDPLPQGYFPETIGMLFDQDRFVAALAEVGSEEEGFPIRRPEGLSESRAQRLSRAFIVNVAKIELWLLGFEVRPDGKTDYGVAGLPGAGTRSDLQSALEEYWEQLEQKSTARATSLAESISPRLFQSLRTTADEAEAVEPGPHADYSRELVEEHLTSQQEIERAWAEVQKRRLSLWDGLKRVWRWIKRGVKKVVSWVGSFFKNLARAFYRYASKGYKIVRLAVTSVVEGIEYYVGGRLASEPDGAVVLFNAPDFDATLYVERGRVGAVPDFLRRLRRRTVVFAFGARILGFALRTIRQIAMGITGWARLLKSLVQSLRDLKPYYERLKAARGL